MPDDNQNNEYTPPRPPIFSDQFVDQIGEDLANQIIDLLCKGLTEPPTPTTSTSLCLEIIVFELDEDILEELVRCAFQQFNPVLITLEIIQILQQINHILNGINGEETESPDSEDTPTDETEQESQPPEVIDICKFDILKLVNKKLRHLKKAILDRCHLRDAIFEEILIIPKHLPTDKLGDIYYITDYVIAQNFRTFLTQQYDNFALKLCNKVTCLNSDIEFLGDQIKQVTINFPAGERGIIEIADAAASVAQAFFSEEDDFNEIYDAVDEVSKLIEDLAEIYEDKLNQLEELYTLAPSGCPLPIEARETLPTIPEVSGPPPIFPIVGLPPTGSVTF